MRNSKLSLCAILAAASLCVIGLTAPADAGAAGSPAKPSVKRVQDAPRIPAGARRLGPLAASATISGAVTLKPRDPQGLAAFIAAVTDKASPDYGHYLAPGAYASRFGPTQATIQAVRADLEAGGLQVTSVARDGLLVYFRGSASQVQATFHTALSGYRLSDGTGGQAATALALPDTISDAVSGVIGLNQLVHLQHTPIRPPRKSGAPAAVPADFAHPPGSPNPCTDAGVAATSSGGLTDDQIAHAYGAFGLYSAGDVGSGQRIAIYELEPFAGSDIDTFNTCYFGATAAGQMAARRAVVPVDGGQPAGPGGGEALLDVQDVSGLAPGANIDVYEAPNTTFGGLDEYASIINNGTDKIVSSSWGLCEQAVQAGEPGVQQAENVLFQQAAAQGQSIFVAAGDTGSDDCNAFRVPAPVSGQNPLSVDDPGSQPYAISVGGTTIDNATQPPAERAWNDGANWGSTGGGLSQSWAMPAWQQHSLVPGVPGPSSAEFTQGNAVESNFGYPTNFCQPNVAGAGPGTSCRAVPDVSAQADEFTGAITVYSTLFGPGPLGWVTFGGTSSATPLWAAMLALINASAACGGQGVGFATPLLYAVASNPASYAASFHDITVGNNDIYGLDNGLVYPAKTGYDLATGLGTPQLTAPGGGAGLAANLCSAAQSSSRPRITSLAPAILSTDGGTVVIHGANFGAAAPAVQVGTATARVTAQSTSQLTVTMPPAIDTVPPGSLAPQDGAGPAEVTVTSADGLSSLIGPAATLQYVDKRSGSTVPSVTGVAPYGGSASAPAPVTILGSGFTGASRVTFGGVAAAHFTVVSPYEITVTPPRLGSQTCAPSAGPGLTPATDICQVQVRVWNAHGASTEATIRKPYEGPSLPFSPMGVTLLPPGCRCEENPAPTEFDYVPQPYITSVSTRTAAPGSLASELGTTIVTVSGKGLDPMTLDWWTLGDPTQGSSLVNPASAVYLSATTLQFVAPQIVPPGGETLQPVALALSARSLGGQSPTGPNVIYAGVPDVSGVINTATNNDGGPDTGGSPISITGAGFQQAVGPIQFVDSLSPFSSGTQFTYTVGSDTNITTQTVSQNPALVDVQVCSVTACSARSSAANPPSTADEFFLFPPGDPQVSSISPATGPASGGTAVTIDGANLGCVTSVSFGGVPATQFGNEPSFLDCGLTGEITATAPPGTAGSTVPVLVTTVESDLTPGSQPTTTATFTYGP